MAPLFALEDPDGETLNVRVTRVFDGDGFLTRVPIPGREIEAEVAVRCGFIDAPELTQPGGSDARDFLHHQITGRWLHLTLLMKTNTGKMADHYKRVVALPYLESPNGWRNVELEMILNGWAWLLDRYCPPDHYYDAVDDAQRHPR